MGGGLSKRRSSVSTFAGVDDRVPDELHDNTALNSEEIVPATARTDGKRSIQSRQSTTQRTLKSNPSLRSPPRTLSPHKSMRHLKSKRSNLSESKQRTGKPGAAGTASPQDAPPPTVPLLPKTAASNSFLVRFDDIDMSVSSPAVKEEHQPVPTRETSDSESEGLTDLTTDSEDSFGWSSDHDDCPELSQLDDDTRGEPELAPGPLESWGWAAFTLFPEAFVIGCMPHTRPRRQAYACCHDIPRLWSTFRLITSYLRFSDIVGLGSVSTLLKRDSSILVTSIRILDPRPAQLTRLITRYSRVHTLALSNIRPNLKEAVLDVLSTCCTLKSLSLSRNKLSIDDIEHLHSVWDYTKVQLTSLDVSHNRLLDAIVQPMIRFLTPFTCLRSLSIANIGMGYFGMQRLAEAALAHPELFAHLTHFDVSDNAIIADGVVALADALPMAPNLISLNLNNCLMGVLGALRLSTALIACRNLQVLRLGNNRLAPGGVQALSKALPMYQELRELDVSHNGIDALSVADGLALTLPECRRLQVLDMSNNPLKQPGVLSLAGAVQRCVKLTVLKLGDSHGGSDGVLALVDMLVTVTRLRELRLQHNHGGPVAAQRLSHHIAAGCGKNLTALDVSGNGLGVDGLHALSSSLWRLPGLVTLSLATNDIDGRNTEVCSAMSAVIRSVSATLTSLDVSGNRLGEGGLCALSTSIIQCRNLVTLNMSHCTMGAKVLPRVLEALQQLPFLSELVANGNHLGRAGIERLLAELPQLSRFVCDLPFLNKGGE